MLRGKNADKRVVALRADIDALPITEQGPAKSAFLSRNSGVAHCCGHDLHTANLLGTARILSEISDSVTGTVVLVFQAGEESPPGGAHLLMQTGALQQLGVQHIYGLHTHPGFAPGTVATREGPLMASTAEFTVRVHGKGGHAASPHLASDPIVTASQLVMHLQTIVSRNIDPVEPAVVTIGQMQGGSAPNIIPETVHLWGTIRSFDTERTQFMFDRIETLAQQTAAAAGGYAEATLTPGYPPVINHPETTRRFAEVAAELLIDMPAPIMAGEDFSFYQEHIPGTFFFLGSGSDQADSRYSWHHPRYNTDERCLKTGMELMVRLAI